MVYQHRWNDGTAVEWAPGKVVCVGRNFAAHARELGNEVPSEPILFIKPATAMVAVTESVSIPTGYGECHVETEMALLIGRELCRAEPAACLAAIAGVGVGFDLTLRDLQGQLKAKGLPWEKAKAFDGACPLSGFDDPQGLDWSNIHIRLQRNGVLQQDGCTDAMITPVAELLAQISQWFTLQPGDVVMTGTPAGVGPIEAGDQLQAELAGIVSVTTQVRGK